MTNREADTARVDEMRLALKCAEEDYIEAQKRLHAMRACLGRLADLVLEYELQTMEGGNE